MRREERALAAWLFALRDTDPGRREAAVQALDQLGWQADASEEGAIYLIAKGEWQRCAGIGAPAVRPLLAAVRERDGVRSERAVEALLELRDLRSVRPLIAALSDPFPDVQQAAARALARLGDPQAIAPLLGLLRSELSSVRTAAAEALARLGWQPDRSEAAAIYFLARGDWDCCAAIGEAALRPLLAAFKSSSFVVRQKAAEALGKTRSVQAIAPLLLGIQDENMNVRASVVAALDRLGWNPDGSVAAAIYYVYKRDWQGCVRVGQNAVQPLLAVLDGAVDEEARQNAAYALKELGWTFERINRYRREERYARLGDEGIVAELLSTYAGMMPAEWRLQARRVGEYLQESGGLETMRRIYAGVVAADFSVAQSLNKAWIGLGGWKG